MLYPLADRLFGHAHNCPGILGHARARSQWRGGLARAGGFGTMLAPASRCASAGCARPRCTSASRSQGPGPSLAAPGHARGEGTPGVLCAARGRMLAWRGLPRQSKGRTVNRRPPACRKGRLRSGRARQTSLDTMLLLAPGCSASSTEATEPLVTLAAAVPWL